MGVRRGVVAIVAGVTLALLAAACGTESSIDDASTEPASAAVPATPSPPETSTIDPTPAPTVGQVVTPEATPVDVDEGAPPPTPPSINPRPSDLLPVISLISEGRLITERPDAHLAELSRCAAAQITTPVAVPLVTAFDPDDEPNAILQSLDRELVAATAAALDRCYSSVVTLFIAGSFGFGSGRENYRYIQCLQEQVGANATWADVVASATTAEPNPFGDVSSTEQACSDSVNDKGEPLSDADQELIDAVDDLAIALGLDLSTDELRCVLLLAGDNIDPNSTIDPANPNIEALAPLFGALDTCVPLSTVIAEEDESGFVYTLCLERELEGIVSWFDLADLGQRSIDLTSDEIEADRTFVALDAARASCMWSNPGEIVVDLGDVLEVDTLHYDGTRLWAGGFDEGGGDRPGNVLIIDGTTGSVVTAIETAAFSIEIISSHGDQAWVARDSSESIQRVHAVDGVADEPVDFPGREIGNLEFTAETLWATDNAAGSLLRHDPITGELLQEIDIAGADWFSSDLIVAAGSLWLTNREDPMVREYDPVSGDLVAEHEVDSEFTMNLFDLGDAVGVYGSSELWRIEPGGPAQIQLIDTFGSANLDVDVATASGEHIAFVDEDVQILALYNPISAMTEQRRFMPGLIADKPNLIVTDGRTIWLTTFDDRLIRFD